MVGSFYDLTIDPSPEGLFIVETVKNMLDRNIILWKGLSPFNQQPIVALLTAVKSPTANKKTGNVYMVQICPDLNILPHEAKKQGLDESVCGNCPHREGSCYVVVHEGVRAAYQSYLSGKYISWEDVDKEAFAAHAKFMRDGSRYGSWGDPAMLPFHVYQDLAQ